VAPQRHAAVVPAPEARPAPVKPAAAPVPLPLPEARPAKPAPARVLAPQPPPEPLSSRIAATATVDQALKLGGSADTYIKKPVRN
jgi:hypothetical protein